MFNIGEIMEFQKTWQPEEYVGPTQFVHLHNHTIFSKLDGVATPDQYADECNKRGYPAMAATEHGNLASVPDMYLSFRKHNIKYIVGYEGYFSYHHQDLLDRKRDFPNQCSARYFNASDDPEDHRLYLRLYKSRHLTILAKNDEGFHNLIKLSTDVHDFGYHSQRGRSRFNLKQLERYKDGLIVLSGCLNGPLSYAIKQRPAKIVIDRHGAKERRRIAEKGELLPGNRNRSIQIIKDFRDTFGEDFYIELQMPVVKDDDKDSIFHRDYHGLIDLLPFRESIELAEDLNIKYCLTNDCHYLKRADHQLQRLLMAIDQKVTIDSPDLWTSNSSEQFMKTRAELWCTFMNYPYNVGLSQDVFERACDTTLEIADKCKNFKPDTSPKTPTWKIPPDDALKIDVETALKNNGLLNNTTKYLIDGRMVTYAEQAAIELDRIIYKGFSSYFLITSDLVRHGREKGFPFSPRGSASGSLVCMLLGIHCIDPLKWGLSFDRFLSPSRGGYLLNLAMPNPIN